MLVQSKHVHSKILELYIPQKMGIFLLLFLLKLHPHLIDPLALIQYLQ